MSVRHLAFPCCCGSGHSSVVPSWVICSCHLAGHPAGGFLVPSGDVVVCLQPCLQPRGPWGIRGLAVFLSGNVAPSCVPVSSRCQLGRRGTSSYKCPSPRFCLSLHAFLSVLRSVCREARAAVICIRRFRQAGETPLPLREGGRREALSEEPADPLGCPLRQHPLFLSFRIFKPELSLAESPRNTKERCSSSSVFSCSIWCVPCTRACLIVFNC